MKTIKVRITGVGTKAEVVKALKEAAKSISKLNPTKLKNGGGFEDETIYCSYSNQEDENNFFSQIIF